MMLAKGFLSLTNFASASSNFGKRLISSDVRILILPPSSLVDEKVRTLVTGLQPSQKGKPRHLGCYCPKRNRWNLGLSFVHSDSHGHVFYHSWQSIPYLSLGMVFSLWQSLPYLSLDMYFLPLTISSLPVIGHVFSPSDSLFLTFHWECFFSLWQSIPYLSFGPVFCSIWQSMPRLSLGLYFFHSDSLFLTCHWARFF